VILEGARTPIGNFLGALSEVPTVDLGVTATREALRRAGVDGGDVQELVFGHARQAGNGPNTGRQVAYRSDIPQEVPAFNVNMACGSGTKAVQVAAEQIMLGNAEVVVAGGMENMTRTPFLLDRMRFGYRMGEGEVLDGMYRDGFLDPLSGCVMGETAENLARKYGILREEQDEFALGSQRKAESGRVRRAQEITPVEAPGRKGDPTLVTEDEHPRADTMLEQLAALKPTFSTDGTVTAGSSSGITDGAAAMVLMSESRARAEGREPLAKLVAFASAGVDPSYMGIGVVPATKLVLERTGLSLQDFDVVELNEAFAAQVLPIADECGIDMDKLNPHGGAIALGHPFGMTGVRIMTTLLNDLETLDESIGLETMCVAGGQGEAMIVERLR
jgi:acetyl-CoA C-acetyltransferase